MLHPVSLPDCALALRRVLALQDKLLELALTANPRNVPLLRRHFPEDAVQWLWRNEQKLLKPLETFAVHPDLTEKQALLNALRHDVGYETHLNDPAFVFELQPKSPTASQVMIQIGKWLGNFYEVLSRSGIPGSIIGLPFDVSQQVLLGKFDEANLEMRVCPVCDGTWMEKTETGVVGSIDHFLPRSYYPALSVHPLNLLPICVICNEKIKGGRNPLTEGRQRALPDIFHPYHRPARDHVRLQVNGSRPWQFVSKGTATDAQITCFPDLFALPDRWQKNADEIDRLVRRRLRDRTAAVRKRQVSMSLDEFATMMDDLVVDMESEWGESTYMYPATWWLRWLRKDKLEELSQDFLG